MTKEYLNPVFAGIFEELAEITKPIRLLPCPFCGGNVKEENPNWKDANAICETCHATWGYCSKQYKRKFELWNERI